MRLNLLIVSGAAVTFSAVPLAAQLRSSRPPPQQQNLPRLMVANPHSFSAQDSTASVRVGHGMRERISTISDRWYKTLLRTQMNEALQQYAYPVDAVLPPMVARQLASSLSARVMVISTMLKGEGNRYHVEARLAGINDEAGQMVRLTQNPNESFEAFGARVADAFAPTFKALPDAKNCENLRQTQPAKATEAAAKALKDQPASGLAHYCLAKIALDKKAPVDTILAHLKLATQGDPLSLPAWTALAVQYQAKGDSAQTIETFKQLLRVAPTNEPLRKEAFRLFLNYGKPEAAENVADEGLQLDPANADLWDLKSSACLFQESPQKNKCALEALEQVFTLDSTKADTTFFTKITFAASRPIRLDTLHLPADTLGSKPARDSVVAIADNEKFLKWSRMAVAKYPNNVILIGQLAEAYSVAGPVDSAVAVTKRLMAVDSSDVSQVIRVAKSLSDAKRTKDAMELLPYIERLGGPEDKEKMAAILATGAFPLLQPPPDYPLAAEIARAALKVAPPNTQIQRFSNYILGLALFQRMLLLDDPAMKTKSCPLAQEMKGYLDEAGSALEAGRAINEAVVTRYLAGVQGYRPHVESLIKAYCK
ncbi:MAG TPA: tetratricopeptide repeat protein [Gemmatimonadales bacterium]|jgi:tetratricopeptide (TPR) repeat protein|nr:tetratricopeptide repeat protein [Gemmatimonadales bacterium]